MTWSDVVTVFIGVPVLVAITFVVAIVWEKWQDLLFAVAFAFACWMLGTLARSLYAML